MILNEHMGNPRNLTFLDFTDGSFQQNLNNTPLFLFDIRVFRLAYVAGQHPFGSGEVGRCQVWNLLQVPQDKGTNPSGIHLGVGLSGGNTGRVSTLDFGPAGVFFPFISAFSNSPEDLTTPKLMILWARG